MKRQIRTLAFFTLIIVCGFSCNTATPGDLSKNSIIPRPVSVTAAAESFRLTGKTIIYVQPGQEDSKAVAQFLADRLNPATGMNLQVKETMNDPGRGTIFIVMNEENPSLGLEGYDMKISNKQIRILANKPAGLFYAVQTLLQILPAKIESGTVEEGPWLIPGGTIRDYPDYAYRGMMLDVARHFFNSDEVKTLIDLMARYKLNQLHLHLADDQGWRIEIKSWPNLTVHGGSTQVGGGPGGFYTQEEYASIVKYAQNRFIAIIPEIDMPGHTNAALASYADLNCSGKSTPLYTGTDVGFSTLCTSKEITYQFISDVFRELAGLTPGSYIHIGGDESHVTKMEDYIPFINRVQEIVEMQGKKTMGWDDIAAATLKPGTLTQHWARIENAKKAIAQGARLILSPASKAYLDMKYNSTTTLGLKWAGYIEVDTAYTWNPETLIPGVSRKDILGIEAALWSETVTNLDEIEFMVFPRLPGYAEIGWTPSNLRSWEEYKVRLADHGKRFEALGINFYRSAKVKW